MTNLHSCPDCQCGPPGEAFAPRPSSSSEWARREAIRAAEEAVKRAKERRLREKREDRGRC